MALHKINLSFNSGEWSPLLSSRVDLDRYEHACQQLENFIILPYGGVLRRPGTQYMGAAKRADRACRLIGFNFSVTTNFILECGEGYIRFWTNGQQVVSSGTTPLEVAAPYTAVQWRDVQYCQINDVMYMCHPDVQPWKLRRLADNNWSMAPVSFKWPPLMQENDNNWQMTMSNTSGAINMHNTAGVFEAGDVGSIWQVGHNMSGNAQTYIEIALGVTSGTTGGLRVRGPWSFTTYGTWQGEVRIIRTVYENGVVETIRTYNNNSLGQRNVASSGTEDRDCSLQLQFITAGQAGTSTPMARLEFSNAKVYGLVRIDSYTGPQDVTGTVVWGLASTAATTFWSQSAFSTRQGFPRTVCLHEQRLVFGGTKKRPLSIHGSQIDDYENFQRSSAADAGYLFNLSANESNPINWLVSKSKLLIGTAGDEWALGPQNADQAVGPGNVDAKQQSTFGSAYIQARMVNEVVLFSQRQARKIRELTFSFEKDGWVAPDLTQLAAHISSQGFAETAFCQQPDAIFWCTTTDGHLVGMTYERDQKVVGWHRHTTQGTFESVATIYGGSKSDEVWFCVKRKVGGADVRYIERFDPNFRPTFDAEDKTNYWYLDCAKKGVFANKTSMIAGLGHLAGCDVGILGDGANQPTRHVDTSTIQIQEPAKTVIVGLPYTSIVMPMDLNLPPSQDGVMQGRKVRIHEMVARIYKSVTAKFSSDKGKTWDEIFFRDREDLMDAAPSVFTGDRRVTTGANYDTRQAIAIMQDRPFPCCVLAVVLWCDFYGT
jgi:hypothetical protein